MQNTVIDITTVRMPILLPRRVLILRCKEFCYDPDQCELVFITNDSIGRIRAVAKRFINDESAAVSNNEKNINRIFASKQIPSVSNR